VLRRGTQDWSGKLGFLRPKNSHELVNVLMKKCGTA
jgi:hypothetical protein